MKMFEFITKMLIFVMNTDKLTAAQLHSLYWTDGDGAQFVLEPLEQAQKDLDEATEALAAAQAELEATPTGFGKKKLVRASEEKVAKMSRLKSKAEKTLEKVQVATICIEIDELFIKKR